MELASPQCKDAFTRLFCGFSNSGTGCLTPIIYTNTHTQVPVIMGVLGVWYNNFFGAQSHALLPYDQVGTPHDLLCNMLMTWYSFLYPSTCTGLLLTSNRY